MPKIIFVSGMVYFFYLNCNSAILWEDFFVGWTYRVMRYRSRGAGREGVGKCRGRWGKGDKERNG
jgi:hypothetical protein